ncbi:unnamed protein product, partial [Eruca vesicaria subsp. sativa]|nr:unnamed protein product [Eruca vesicaria subsp. sativa]
MSANNPNSAIYLIDTAKEINKKVQYVKLMRLHVHVNSAFSGGKDNPAEQAKFEADLEVDTPLKYLNFFLDDDTELEHIKKEYGEGRMLSGEVKQRLTEVLTEIVERHRKARAAVTDEMVDTFMV